VVGYGVGELPGGRALIESFRECGRLAEERNIRLSFHPDQFVVLNSPNRKTLEHSIAELEYQTEVAEWVGADTINIHAGGAYGDKTSALKALASNIEKLPDRVRCRLTLENDDRTYRPADLISLCKMTSTPLVYDVHHHRCLPDGLSVEEATGFALETWNREPLFHISSPIEGWNGPKPGRHHDFIDPDDFPAEWLNLDLTVEVEAKAKEIAVLRLKKEIELHFERAP